MTKRGRPWSIQGLPFKLGEEMRKIKFGIILVIAVIGLAACSPAASLQAESPTQEAEATIAEDPAEAADVTVEIKLFNFPEVVEVPVGTTVTWLNQDGTQHSVTNGTPEQDGQPEQLGGVFDSGFFEQDESYSFTFTEPGDYAYFCMRHNHMQGIIRVVP
jgi:plastocyanin